jgi:sucrose phosphorylase
MGDWDDVNHMHEDFRLMFDMVVNHVSVESEWFQGFLAGEKKYEDYFITVNNETDLSAVFRPRTLPLLTAFEKTNGEKVNVWTTFSADQVDLNYASANLLLNIVDVILAYVGHGASYLRLDAVAFIWKEIGTNCLHLPKTHRIVTLMRHILDVVAPEVVIITETNVPHKDNISYFGNGYDEAQMVYNFSLPPLVLYSFHQENTKVLTQWADSLKPVSENTTFFNFLASHDGIGVMPAKGLLNEDEILAMAKRVEELGGLVSYKTNSDGSLMPYELNVNYLSALGEAGDVEVQAKRFLASQAIMLALQGVPGIYFHSLFGSENWIQGVQASGQNRTINREKPKRDRLEKELKDEQHLRHFVFEGYKKMLKARKENSAFSPLSSQKVLDLGKKVFCVVRGDGDQAVLCVVNVCDETIVVDIPDEWAIPEHDVLGKVKIEDGKLYLDAFQVSWLKKG